MRLPEVPQAFWSDPSYQDTVVTWDGTVVHIAHQLAPGDTIGVAICGSDPDVVAIVGGEHDDADICPGCVAEVTSWQQ